MKLQLTLLLSLFVGAGCVGAGCVGLDERRMADRAFIEGEVLERTGLRLDSRHEAVVASDNEFAIPLDADTAVRIALAHEPRVDELLAQLGHASAQRVLAELVRNPLVRVEVLLASGGTDFGAGLVQPLADLLTLSRRRSIAEERNEAERMRIAREVVRLVHDVRRAWSTAAFDASAAALAVELREAEEAAARLARELHAAGNTTAAALHAQLAAADMARLDAERAESRAHSSRVALARAIGRPQSAEIVVVAAPVTALELRDTSEAEAAALAASLELRELRAETRARTIAAGLAPLHASTDGSYVEGTATNNGTELTASVPLPIFDDGRASASAEAFAVSASRAAEQRAALDVSAAVKHIEARRSGARARVHLARTEAVPNARALVVAALQQYNAMQVDVFTVLEARRVELDALRDELAAARELDWHEIAFAQLLAGSTPRLDDGPHFTSERD